MKLISLNVALFEANNEKLEVFLGSNQADIACFQEVTKRLDDQALDKYVSKELIDHSTKDLSSSFFAPIWVMDKFEKSDFHGQEFFQFDLGGRAEFGNYVKTKFPIFKGHNIFVQNSFTYVTDWSKWPEEDYRAFEVVDLVLPGEKRLRVVNYHGIWSRNKQGNDTTRIASEQIKKCALGVSCPSIICGDFNLFPDTESIKVFDSHFVNLCNRYDIRTTRPENNELNDEKRNVVDYVFVSKDIIVNSFEVPNFDISDHLPLLLDFDLPN